MASTVKQKIRLGTLFLFLLLLLSSIIGMYHLARLRNDAKMILENNYESLEYCHALQNSIDSSAIDAMPELTVFDSILRLQEHNITEPGEKEFTADIRQYFDLYRAGDHSAATLDKIRTSIQKVLALNMNSIDAKNNNATNTANQALTYISLIAGIVFLVGLTFTYNFPSIITDPITSITEGIKEVAEKNYHHRINIDRKDEFGQMATAFNNMTERLEYFESSNLNKIIFEKTRAEAVINSLKDASIGIDRNGMVLFANDQALQLLGVKAGDVVGKAASEVSKMNELFRFLLEDKNTIPFKIVVDNRENYFIKEVMEIDQEVAGSRVIILKNITSFKELDVAKTNFIATISHELKTPLAASDLSIKLLEDERVGKLSAEQKELIVNLKQDNQRMLRILSELLNMAQVEAGKIQLELQEADPATIADNVISAVESIAKEKNIIILKKYANDEMLVKADGEKTGWVLNNFLTNAIKYSPAGSTVQLIIEHINNEILFSVADNGPGIPPEYLNKVFDRFFKVPGSKARGTGLGLAISKEFIEAQQGSAWVKSEFGAGSVFGFNLPAVKK